MEKYKFSEEIKCLGLIIKNLRIDNKITQEVLASYCDLDVRTIQRIEKGEQNITLSVLFSLASALKTEPNLLIEKCLVKHHL